MKNLFVLLILVNLCMSAYAQQAIKQEYYYITEVGYKKLKQNGDTLYSYRCQKDFSCFDADSERYKILSANNVGDYLVLKMEILDSIPMTSTPYSNGRFVVLALKFLDDKALSYIREAKSYTRNQIDTLQLSPSELDGKFGYTYYTRDYLQELSKRKQITSKSEIEELMKLFEEPEYQAIIERYENTRTGDLYGRSLGYELFFKAIIEKGYSPIYAIEIINKLMR